MKRDEQEELRRAEVDAAERAARDLDRIARVAEAPARAERERGLAVIRSPLRRIFEGERGAVLLLRAIPGFADLWERAVPTSHIRCAEARDGAFWYVVSCMCGEHVALQTGTLADCPGECGRYFLHAGKSIRVKRFELSPAPGGVDVTERAA